MRIQKPNLFFAKYDRYGCGLRYDTVTRNATTANENFIFLSELRLRVYVYGIWVKYIFVNVCVYNSMNGRKFESFHPTGQIWEVMEKNFDTQCLLEAINGLYYNSIQV